jgi:hypothetical protein
VAAKIPRTLRKFPSPPERDFAMVADVMIHQLSNQRRFLDDAVEAAHVSLRPSASQGLPYLSW